jgi:hypothetical protein
MAVPLIVTARLHANDQLCASMHGSFRPTARSFVAATGQGLTCPPVRCLNSLSPSALSTCTMSM